MKPLDDNVLFVTIAVPPLATSAAFARLPVIETVVSDTVTREPAPSAENPLPRWPVAVTVLPLSKIEPPERARTAEAGSMSALEVLLDSIALFVRTTLPPDSALAAFANVPAVLKVIAAPLIRLPDPRAYKAWLPTEALPAPVVVTRAAALSATSPPLFAKTPKAATDLVEIVPPR